MDLKNSDAFILMQFQKAVKPLKNLPLAECTEKMGIIGKPYFERLKKNGHSLYDAIDLLRQAWKSI